MTPLPYPTPLPYLPNSIYLEVFGYLSSDKSAIRACTQVSKLFCGLSSVHLMSRVTCVVADALVASLYDASLRGRLFYTKELVLVRREPKAIDGSSGHAASKGKGKGKGRKIQTESTSGSNSVPEIAYEDPSIFIPPPEGHLNVFMLHSLLRNMPHIESLTIRRLHVVPGPSFYIQPFPNIHALHFEGVDTGNAFHSLLPLWDHIDTLTISEHWNGMVIPDGPVHLPDVFPYNAEEGSGVTSKLRIGAVKTTTVMPKVLHYWTKALRVFLDPEGSAIGSLGLHESLFLFETDIAATDSAILEIVNFVREVDLDMSSNQSLYLTRKSASVVIYWDLSLISCLFRRCIATSPVSGSLPHDHNGSMLGKQEFAPRYQETCFVCI